MALSADASTILWRTTGGVLRSQAGASFAVVSSVPSGAAIASDKLIKGTFYGMFYSNDSDVDGRY